MNPSAESFRATGSVPEWKVTIDQQGRCGTVRYVEAAGAIAMSWEFGGKDVVAVIYIQTETAWPTAYPWAADRRGEILQRVVAEVIRQRAPGCRVEIDDRGWINLWQGSPQGVPPAVLPSVTAAPPPSPRAQHLAFRARRTKLMSLIAIALLLFAALAIGFKMLFSVKAGPGTPVGLSVRAPEHIATLIQTLEPYVPSLHRNPDNDRYRLALLLTPQDGRAPGKLITLAKQRRAQEFTLAKLLGCDGTTVWFSFNGIGGVNLKCGELVGEADLRRANPLLDETWDDQRRMDFDQRLRLHSADRQRVYEVTPETLQAIAVTSRAAKSPFEVKPADLLCSGARPSPTEWLGVYSAKAAAGEYKPKSWLGRLNRADDAKEMRSFYRSALGPELDRGNREILSQTRLSADEYYNAAFVRARVDADALRLSAPDSFLMLYTSKAGLGGTSMLARVSASGEILWKTDTGVDRFTLTQLLPEARYMALKGTRLPVAGKVSEPILVTVDTQSGVASTVSLWQ